MEQNAKLNLFAVPFIPSHLRKPTPVSVAFFGLPGSGKSTLCAQLLIAWNVFTERDIKKAKWISKEIGHDSEYLPFLISNEHDFPGTIARTAEFKERHYVIHDCEGDYSQHNLIADLGVFVIEANPTKITQEATLIKDMIIASTFRYQNLCVVINKMDKCSWDLKVFEAIKEQLNGLLDKSYNKHVEYIPIDAKTGINVISKGIHGNYRPLLEVIVNENSNPLKAPLTVVIMEKSDRSFHGKVVSGILLENSNVILTPLSIPVSIMHMQMVDGDNIEIAHPGTNVEFSIKPREIPLSLGSVLCEPSHIIPRMIEFMSEIKVHELPKARPVITKGYYAILHIHCAIVDCIVEEVVEVNGKKGKWIVRKDDVAKVWIKCKEFIAAELWENSKVLGGFVLRVPETTIATGKIISYKAFQGYNYYFLF
eukprot:TRINITY_DN1824_c0_g1_i5.p1 TRINITY_DN1824_c0_g1~~TRINITY_DN1824_c0_g1_i5.p1  ORF type:complete len:424 (-),score=38.18 TRINITY_DN1824_c0_g1_i5:170-1441(-)